MAENNTFKRKRVTEDILPSFAITSDFIHQDTNLEKLTKINLQVERLQNENFKLVKQLECSKITHDLSIKENAQKIGQLIKEKNDCKARAIEHSKRSEEASKTLQIMKAKHINVTAELRKSLEDSRSTINQLEQALDSQQRFNREIEYDFNQEKDSYINEIEGLNQRIQFLEQRNQESDNSTKEALARELELVKKVNELEAKLLESDNSTKTPSNDAHYQNLLSDYTNVCKKVRQYQIESTKLSNELKHYKGISQNVEYLREEADSLKQQLLKTEEISNAKFILEVENANLLSERDAWTRYLESKPEYNQLTPGSIIYNLTKQVDKGKYLSTKVQQLEEEIKSRENMIYLLEDHVYQLKSTISEKEREKSFNDEELNVYKRREEILKNHISILENQLKLYDYEEKTFMEQSYDEKKTIRISELESFLNEIENQKVEITQVKVEDPIVVSNGPYEKITSGTKIIEFLRQIHEQKELYLKDLKEAKAKAQEKFSENINPSQIDEESNKENIPSEERCLTFIENPASEDYAIRQDLLNRLKKENQELLNMNLENHTDIETIQVPRSTIINYQKEIESFQKKIEGSNRRIEIVRSTAKDQMREMETRIRDLLGYSVSFRADGSVRLESVFVDGGELTFIVKHDTENNVPVLRIRGSEKEFYIDQFKDTYQTYITQDQNIIAFLNAAALELYMQYKSTLTDYEDETMDNVNQGNGYV